MAGSSSSTPNDNPGFTDVDILCCKDHKSFHHAGNVSFRNLILKFRPAYREVKSRGDKSVVIKMVLSTLRQKGARFLKPEPDGSWGLVRDDIVNAKVAHALRFVRSAAKKTTNMKKTTPQNTAPPTPDYVTALLQPIEAPVPQQQEEPSDDSISEPMELEKVKSEPMEEVKSDPMEEVKSGADQVKSEPAVEQVKSAPMEEEEQLSKEETSQGETTTTEEAPRETTTTTTIDDSAANHTTTPETTTNHTTTPETTTLDTETGETTPPTSTVPITDNDITDEDIMCCKDHKSYHHPGNVHFRNLIQKCRPVYQEAATRAEKSAYIQGVIAATPGRFLKKETDGQWSILSDDIVKGKVAHALRFGRAKPDEQVNDQRDKEKTKEESSAAAAAVNVYEPPNIQWKVVTLYPAPVTVVIGNHCGIDASGKLAIQSMVVTRPKF